MLSRFLGISGSLSLPQMHSSSLNWLYFRADLPHPLSLTIFLLLLSLYGAIFPSTLKKSLVLPILTKTSLDADTLSSISPDIKPSLPLETS